MNTNVKLEFSTNDPHKPFYRPFLDHLSKTTTVNQQTVELIAKCCTPVTFRKGERLLNSGKRSKYIYFIISGECMSYYIGPGGKKITWFFHFNTPESTAKNLFAVDYKSFLSGEPATISIDALSPVTAIRFSVKDVETLVNGSPDVAQWLRSINEITYMQTFDRITTILTLSAPERYEKFLSTEPYLLNMFSNYHVASYLNVAPQSLSRIRKQLASGGMQHSLGNQ